MFESRSGVLDTTICDKVCQWLVLGQWFSPPIWLPRYNWNIVESGVKHRCSRRTCSSCSRCATLLYYSCYNPGDMLLMIKGPDGDYDKLNISMVISYFVTVDQVMIATVRNFQSDDFNLTTRNPWFSSFLVSSQCSIKEIMIGAIRSEISEQLRDVYSICRCFWNVATYK